MDNKDLFRREENGYNTADVEKYINTLKTEYRRVFEYAKKNETDKDGSSSLRATIITGSR